MISRIKIIISKINIHIILFGLCTPRNSNPNVLRIKAFLQVGFYFISLFKRITDAARNQSKETKADKKVPHEGGFFRDCR
ncbi:hypothetical protein HYN48_13205 [Flavobacterium magnum]|uniref:Uncharacterized protein n=1 Tax=Flavobacterium magnum TaxID=2162713 RepID=A0A2S0RGA3_9FLAO|nr:hypothetical protein HYN48_13205 [Flavobacterium magnum]